LSETKARALPITFSSFVVSLAGSAMMHLGEAPNPGTGKASQNLPLARNTIDLLAMLEAKTTGNLDDEEKKLLDALLGELSGKYQNIAGES
jgi:hypothetical protein